VRHERIKRWNFHSVSQKQTCDSISFFEFVAAQNRGRSSKFCLVKHFSGRLDAAKAKA
jgi:hypothetical protein